MPSAEQRREGIVAALRGSITVDAGDQTVALSHEVLEVTARGGVAERTHGRVTGVRVSLPTPEPVSPTPGP